tara:strand:- start:105 stop:212 length:108 start_codon:yes stop_codon:yes gene_type:complete
VEDININFPIIGGGHDNDKLNLEPKGDKDKSLDTV